MKLRGRFTLWFAVAALVPIAIAALVTREVLARSYRQDYQRTRTATEQTVRGELRRLDDKVKNDRGIFPAPEVKAKLVPDLAESPQFTRLLTRTWTRFKTGK